MACKDVTDKTVFFVRSQREFEQVQAQDSPCLHFLTYDLDLYRALAKDDCVCGTWEFLDELLHRQVMEQAIILKEVWYADIRQALHHRGVNLGAAIKIGAYCFFYEALLAARIAERFIASSKPHVLGLPQIAGVPVRNGFPYRADVVQAMFAYVALRMGVQVEWYAVAQPAANADLRDVFRKWIPLTLRRWRSNLIDRTKQSRQENLGARKWLTLTSALDEIRSGIKRAVFAASNQSFLMMLPLAQALEATGDWSALRVHTGYGFDYASVIADARYSDFLSTTRLKPFQFLEFYGQGYGIAEDHIRPTQALYDTFAALHSNYQGPYPELFANTYLEFQYRDMLQTQIQETRNSVSIAIDLLSKFSPDLLFVGNSSHEDEIFANAGWALGIPTILLPHNRTWAFPEVYDYPVDYIMVPNEGLARWLSPIIEPRQPLVCGELKPILNDTGDSPFVQAKNRQTLLILTGGYVPMLSQCFNARTFAHMLDELVIQFLSQEKWDVWLRPHPRADAHELIRSLERKWQSIGGTHLQVRSDALAEELIVKADYIVLLDYVSSPVIAAWRLQKPMVLLVSSFLFHGIQDLFESDWFPRAGNCRECSDLIFRFETDAAWRQGWLTKGFQLYQEYYAPMHGGNDIFIHQVNKVLEECRK